MIKVNGTKYKVYLGNSTKKEFFCCIDSLEDIGKITSDMKVYYTRMLYQLGYVMIDYGSWTNFLYVEMTQEEFNEEILKEK